MTPVRVDLSRGDVRTCAISVTAPGAPLLTRVSITPPMSGMSGMLASALMAISTISPAPGSACRASDRLLGSVLDQADPDDRLVQVLHGIL